MMKKVLWSAIPLVLLVFVIFLSQVHAQPMGPDRRSGGAGYGPAEPDQGWNYCPYCGAPYEGARGYGRGQGYGMHHWGLGPGYGMGPGWGSRRPYRQLQEPLEMEDAKKLVEDYLKFSRNPNLKVGKIEDKGQSFEVEIVTKEGSLVDKLAVNKETGWVGSIY